MKQQYKKEVGVAWAFTIFGSILGFLINIVASSVFDIYVNGFKIKALYLLVGFLLGTLFFIGLLSYIFENMDRFREEKNGLSKIVGMYVKSLIKILS